MAAMTAENAAAAIDDLALALAQARRGGQEGALALAGEEAEVLALALRGHREARVRRDAPNLGLGQLGEREAQVGEGPGATAESM